MNWLVFFIGAWVMMGLELGLRDGLALGPTGGAPSFALIYLVFVALSSPKRTAMWAGAAVGLLLDLTRALPAADGLRVVTTIGPMTLGATLAAYTVVQVRGVLYQRNPFTGPIVVAVAVFLAHLVAIATLELRSWYDAAVDLAAVREVARSALTAAYSAGVALLLGVMFKPILPMLAAAFQFDPTPSAWRWGFGRRASSHR